MESISLHELDSPVEPVLTDPHRGDAYLARPQNEDVRTRRASPLSMGNPPTEDDDERMLEILRKRKIAIFKTDAGSVAVKEARARAQVAAEEYVQSAKKQVDKYETNPIMEPGKNPVKAMNYRRRLAMNRESAAMSRVRRQAYIEELERFLAHYETEIEGLKKTVEQLERENKMLRVGEVQREDECAFFRGRMSRNPTKQCTEASELTSCPQTSYGDTSSWLYQKF